MLATGGSLILCIEKLKEAGVSEDKITFINLVSCEKGLLSLHEKFPHVHVITAAIDPLLND